MTDADRLTAAVARANKRYAAMTPEQQKAMWQAQRESFIRGMTTPCEHGVLDFESCGECRGGAPQGPTKQPWFEERPDATDGSFDELVARFADGMVHVEMMSDKTCYVGFYWDDGRYAQWWINSKKKLSSHHESGTDMPPRFTAHGVDRGPVERPND